MILECRNREKDEFIISSDLIRRPRDDLWRDGFVSFEKVFGDSFGDGDKVCLEVVGILDDEGRVDDSGK